MSRSGRAGVSSSTVPDQRDRGTHSFHPSIISCHPLVGKRSGVLERVLLRLVWHDYRRRTECIPKHARYDAFTVLSRRSTASVAQSDDSPAHTMARLLPSDHPLQTGHACTQSSQILPTIWQWSARRSLGVGDSIAASLLSVFVHRLPGARCVLCGSRPERRPHARSSPETRT
jgi:hypothetical protein